MKKGKKQMTTIRVDRSTVDYLADIKRMLELKGSDELTLEQVVIMAAEKAYGDDLARLRDVIKESQKS